MIALNNPVYTAKIDEVELWCEKILYYSRNFKFVHFLKNSTNFLDTFSRYDLLVGLGSQASYVLPSAGFMDDPISRLRELNSLNTGGWLMCHLNYDVKNSLESLQSNHTSSVNFPDVHAYIPQWVITVRRGVMEIYGDKNEVNQLISAIDITHVPEYSSKGINLIRPDKQEYIQKVNTVQEFIRDGRIYEMNLCQDFTSQTEIDDVEGLYLSLQNHADAPFSAFYKMRGDYLLCSSPERYLQSDGRVVRSQPIKGTIKRSGNDAAEKLQLSQSVKDGAEHIMIVDLVRNDLKRCGKTGTVKVEDLKGIYSFKHVHHMISTISAELMNGHDALDAFKASFPMGSMTGAPKIEAMKVIEELENFKRGLYSGTIGYINPEGDVDFNVVIRSILYDSIRNIISCPVGGAIVYDSDAEDEWNECLLKLESIERILAIEN